MSSPVGKVFRHYKGDLYYTVFVGTHTETEEQLVVYYNVKNPEKIWIRPLFMFEETVEWEGQVVPRFKLLTD